MKFAQSEIDQSWIPFFTLHQTLIEDILAEIAGQEIAPLRDAIFRVFTLPISAIKVVIIGQDPYPGRGIADGLAFSTPKGNPLPASLRNIFKEYQSDLNYPSPTTTDLSQWHLAGVFLMNRTLTTVVGERNAHVRSQWNLLTEEVAKFLGRQSVVALLWGNYAQELAQYFPHHLAAPHPSPLSAHRGFFNSRPFSQANQLLVTLGREPVDWRLP